jgi:hypothetical protein
VDVTRAKCRALDGFNQWGVFSQQQAHTKRTSVMINVPTEGLAGAFRKDQYKLLFEGMQVSGLHAQ